MLTPHEQLKKPDLKRRKYSETCLKRNLGRRNLAFSGKFSRFRGPLSPMRVWNGTCLQRQKLLRCDPLYAAFAVLLFVVARYCSVVQAFVLQGYYSSSIFNGYLLFGLTYGTDTLSRNVCNKLPTYATRHPKRVKASTVLSKDRCDRCTCKSYVDISQQLARHLPGSKAISFTKTVVVSMKFWLNY